MQTIVPRHHRDKPKLHPKHRHLWRSIGAHTLHVGQKRKGKKPYPEKSIPIRETRQCFVCTKDGCREIRVKIRQFLAYGTAPSKIILP